MPQIEVIRVPPTPWLLQALIFSVLVHILLLLLPANVQKTVAASPVPLQLSLQKPSKASPPPPPSEKPIVMTKPPERVAKKRPYRAPPAPRKNTRASSPVSHKPVAATKEVAIAELDLNPNPSPAKKELVLHYADIKHLDAP